MYSLNGTKIKQFRLSTAYHIADVGTLGPGAVNTHGMANVTGALTLIYVDGGVEVRGIYKGKKIRSLVPVGNIVGMDLELEENNKPAAGSKDSK